MRNFFTSAYTKHLIGSKELKDLISNPQQLNNTRILDSTLFLPNDVREIKYIYPIERIPYSQLFDIEEVSDKSNPNPYMMPNKDYFIKQMKKLDIRKSDNIICYDRHGMFTAPRVWFTLRMFGHDKVRVLNGGYPKWKKESNPIEEYSHYSLDQIKKYRQAPLSNDFDYKKESWRVVSMKEMFKVVALKKQGKSIASIIDARPDVRYKMLVDEPTVCKRRGKIDFAVNIPIKDLVDDDNCFKDPSGLLKAFKDKNVNMNELIYLYCGCGLSALSGIIALSILGKYDKCRLYDGSWTEVGNHTVEEIKRLKESLL